MKQARYKRFKKIGIVLGVVLLLLVAGVCLLASKLQGDEEVVADIDRHFSRLEGAGSNLRYSVGSIETTADDGDGLLTAGALAANETGNGKGRKVRRRKASRSGTGSSPPREGTSSNRWKGVRKIAPGTYIIDRRLAADAQKRPKAYIQGVRARLVAEDEKPIGFQLMNVSTVCPIYALGLRSGDVLIAVNGFKLKTIDEAVLAATSLRFANQYRVDIRRGKKSLSLYYRIADK
jgi:hypothetical protein